MYKRKKLILIIFCVFATISLIVFLRKDWITDGQLTEVRQNEKVIGRSDRLSSIAIVVVIANRAHIKRKYETAQKSLQCYCESRGLPYYLIVRDEWEIENASRNTSCLMGDFMYQRHCILVDLMKKSRHEWFLMIDADMGVINPNQSFYNFLPKLNNKELFAVFSDRDYSSEIMAGTYLARNNEKGKDFLMSWARSWNRYMGGENLDNGALPVMILRKYLPHLEAETSKCELWWKASRRHWCRYLLYVICTRILIDNHPIAGLKFLPKTRSYYRDGWLTGGKFSSEDFLLHGWKEPIKDKRTIFMGWMNAFSEEAFNDMNLCKSREQAHQLWRYKMGFQWSVEENRRELDAWIERSTRERRRLTEIALTFNVTQEDGCDRSLYEFQ